MHITLKNHVACNAGLNEGIFYFFITNNKTTEKEAKEQARILAIQSGYYLVREEKAFIHGFLVGYNNAIDLEIAWKTNKNLLKIVTDKELIVLKGCQFYSSYNYQWYLDET